MSQTAHNASASGNALLGCLPQDDFERIAARLHPVTLERGQVVLHAGEPVEAAYFPGAGCVSMLAPIDGEGGHGLEVGMVGREGMVGLPIILGQDQTLTRAEVQLPGHGWRISAAALRQEMAESADLRTALLRYVHQFHNQVTQTAACNGRHAIVERLARWLLMSRDRWESDEMPLTQEYLSSMLGVRRAGVTVAAGTLQKAGLITHRNGAVRILDRPGLEKAACECYRIVRQAEAPAFSSDGKARGPGAGAAAPDHR